MKRKFITNLSLILFLNLLVKPFWKFGIEVSVQNVVGAESYGLFFPLFNLSLILNILLDLGITNYNNRNISQHHQLLSKHFSNIILLRFILAIFYTLVLIVCALIVKYDLRQFYLLMILALNQFLLSFVLYLRSNISGLQLFKTDSIISVLDRVVMIAICAILLWGNVTKQSFKIEWFAYSQTAAYLITCIVAFIVVASKSEFVKLHFDRNFYLVILKQSFPYALLIMLMAFYNRIDAIMLERMLDDGKLQAGIYAQAYRIPETLSQFSYLFAVLLLPMFSRMLKKNESVSSLTKLSFLLIIIPSIITAVACVTFRNNIISFLYKEHIELSSTILGILIISFIPISVTYIFGTLLTANGNLKLLNIMAAGGMVLNIILNLILIPHFQTIGSAIANLITQFATALAQVFIAVYIFKFKFNIRMFSSLTLFTLAVIIIAWLSMQLPYFWGINFLLVFIIGAVIALVVKLLDIKSLYNLITSSD